jgi:DNA-binding MarR family transcriptional regulator
MHDPNDRRKALIVPTEKGRQLRGTIWAAWREIQDDLWGGFSDDERETFRELLRKFRNKNIKQIR